MQHDCDLCSSPYVARWESCVLQVQRTPWVQLWDTTAFDQKACFHRKYRLWESSTMIVFSALLLKTFLTIGNTKLASLLFEVVFFPPKYCFRWKQLWKVLLSSWMNTQTFTHVHTHTCTHTLTWIRRGVGPAMQSSLASWCHVSHFNSFQELVRIFTVLTMCTHAWVTHTLAAHPFFSLFPSRSLSLLSVAAPFFSLFLS